MKILVMRAFVPIFCWLVINPYACAQLSRSSELLGKDIDALNQQLTTLSNQPANAGRIAGLLARRTSLVFELIAAAPDRALSVALSPQLSAGLRSSSAAGYIKSQGEW